MSADRRRQRWVCPGLTTVAYSQPCAADTGQPRLAPRSTSVALVLLVVHRDHRGRDHRHERGRRGPRLVTDHADRDGLRRDAGDLGEGLGVTREGLGRGLAEEVRDAEVRRLRDLGRAQQTVRGALEGLAQDAPVGVERAVVDADRAPSDVPEASRGRLVEHDGMDRVTDPRRLGLHFSPS